MLGVDSASSVVAGSDRCDPCLVAAIGTAAHSLGPTEELLRGLGASPGVALLVVSRHDTAHDTVEALRAATSMPVSTVDGGTRLALDHVYVVPANVGLTLTDGVAQLEPRRELRGSRAPLDSVFEALAQDLGARSIGVVLSGTGSDGAKGIRRIRMVGGFTFAQDATAEPSGMPAAAIATGCVDFVASPAGIARQLVLLGDSSVPGPFEGDSDPDAAFRRLLAAISVASGIDFNKYRPATIRRRAQRQMLLRGVTSLSDYAGLVESAPDEARSLVEDVLIHVTAFFRDGAVFEALESQVFPQLLDSHRAGQAIRIWVPACSSGEEAYSIAISLTEFLERRGAREIPIKVFGTDVSPSAIQRARSALYGCRIEQEVAPERLQAHFSKRGSEYHVRQHIRDTCVFACHDVTRDPPFSQIDLISCRNLMIYLGSELQARVLALFHYALQNDGFLLLGASETTHVDAAFAGVDAKHKIYRRLPVGPQSWLDFRSPRSVHPAGARTSFLRGPDVLHEADRVLLARFSPAGVVVTEDLLIVQFRGQTAPFLAPAPGVPSFELLRMARQELRLPLRQAIEEARSQERNVLLPRLPLLGDEAHRAVDVEVIPFASSSTRQRFFIVLFEEHTNGSDRPAAAALSSGTTSEAILIDELRAELGSTRAYLNGTIEQLEASNEEITAANEEITSSNEELHTTNEELQSAKEELQAKNSELCTINDELAVRNAEATRLNDDLSNVLSSTEIPIVLLGRDGRIGRFAPAAAKAFGLRAADIGQPLSDVRDPLALAAVEMGREVLADMRIAERTLRDRGGRWYQLTARPYVTLKNRIDGTVITAFDVDAIKRSTERLTEAQQYAESILETVVESLVVIDGERRVRSANRAFYEKFGLSAPRVVGCRLQDLGFGPSMGPAMDRLLEALAAGEGSPECRVDVPGRETEPATFLVSAVSLPGGPNIRLSFIDVTDRELARKALERSEAEFFDVLATAAVGILVTNMTGQIMFANAELAQIFGYAAQELIGQSVDRLVPDRLGATHAQLREKYHSVSLRRRMGSDRELVGRRKDGSEVAIEVTLSPLVRKMDRLVVSFVVNVTTARESQRNILQYQEKLQQTAFEAALAAEAERRRIANDLHDRIGQALSFAEMRLKSAKAVDGVDEGAVDEALVLLGRTSEDVRTLQFELSPPILYDLGIEAALSWLADDLGRRSGIAIKVEADELPARLPDAAAGILFRGVRELLTNVIKHAQAPEAHVSLRRSGDGLVVRVEDRGVGFDAESLSLDADRARFGLFSVREQLRRLGGKLTIDSVERRGTCVSIEMPLVSSGIEGTDTGRSSSAGSRQLAMPSVD